MLENNKEWPASVIERLQGYADRTGISVDEATTHFTKWLGVEFSVDDPSTEDEYLLKEWAEMFGIETRNLGGGGSKRETSAFVGMLVGIEDSSRDMRKNAREKAVNMFRNNQDRAVGEKHIGIVSAKNGVWCVNGTETNEKVEGSKLPWFAFEEGDLLLCLLNTNQASKQVGKPMAPTSISRNLYLLGSPQGDNNISIWKVSTSGKSMDAEYRYHEPCVVQVIPPTQAGRDTVYTNKDFCDTIEYTDNFLPESERVHLKPERFLINDELHNSSVELHNLVDTHADRKIKLPSGITLNPMVIVKGNVSRLNKESMSSEYDVTGRTFRMSVTSLGLQSRSGRESLLSEVTVWIPGKLYDDHHPFEFNDNGTWKPYAEKTPVIIFGRLKLRPYNNEMLPSITALGIYTFPRTARPAAEGGDTSLSQFGGEQ
jgi:hypothetical protein